MKPFARFFRWVRGKGRPGRSRPARVVLAVVECLEERCLTAVFSGLHWAVAPLPSRRGWLAAPTAQAGRPAAVFAPLVLTAGDSQTGGDLGTLTLAAALPQSDAGLPVDVRDAVFAGWWQAPDNLGSAPADQSVTPVDSSAPDPAQAAASTLTVVPPDAGADANGQGTAPDPASGGPVGFAATTQPPDGSAPLAPAAAQVDPAPPQVITPTLVALGNGTAGDGGPADAQAAVFRITRAPAGDAALEVRYALTTFGSAGAATSTYEATIPARAVSVDVPAGTELARKPGGPEIVTLKVLDGGGYQVSRPSVTLFPAGGARACSEAALLAAYQVGNSAEAFSVLVARNRPAVVRTCFRVVGNWHDAEDVAQLVFLALAQHQVLLQSRLARWLCAVARNASIAFLRSRNRRSRHEAVTARPVMVAPDESGIDLREYLSVALTQLAAPLRDAVQLRYLEGRSQLEAARMLGCPRGTLSQRAALGVGRLRGILAAECAAAGNG